MVRADLEGLNHPKFMSNYPVHPGRFDLTEPPQTTVTNGEAGLQGRFEWFDHTEPPRTTVMKGEAGLKAIWSEFGEVQTTS